MRKFMRKLLGFTERFLYSIELGFTLNVSTIMLHKSEYMIQDHVLVTEHEADTCNEDLTHSNHCVFT